MNRWLHNFTTFCDLTASGISNCCPLSSNLYTGHRIVDLPKSPGAQSRFDRTQPKHAIHNIQAASRFEPSVHGDITDYTRYSESPGLSASSRSERPPVAIYVHTFNFPDRNVTSTEGYVDSSLRRVSSPGGYVEVVTAHGFGAAEDRGAVRSHGFVRQSLLPQPGNVQGDSDGLVHYAGKSGGGEELAIHRAAWWGAEETLRFVLRCRHHQRLPHTTNSENEKIRQSTKASICSL